MPTLPVLRDDLFTHLGRTYTDEEFDELCFEFGVELDEITSERDEALKSDTVKLSKAEIAKLSDSVVYKIDVPANRYDLLCIEGLSRAIKVFLGDLSSPSYTVKAPAELGDANKMVVVESTTSTVRPFVVCAILRDITFTPQRYQSFIELQDQLHRNLCRNRTLVAIGTHDMDTVQGPWKYDARNPDDINFVPLTHDEEGTSFTGRTLLEHYEKEPACKHLKPYVPIIKDSPLYPVVLDGNDTVMSLPPIINGAHSKISVGTKNVFIECTATDLTKANIVLDTVVAMFSEHCAEPYTVEPVTVSYVDAEGAETKSYVTPQMFTRRERAGVDFVNSLIGIHENPERMVQLCDKLQLGPASIVTDADTGKQMLEVTVPPTRSDILHPVDIAEDVGIAYGYNNIVKRVPTTSTVGGEQPLNKLTDLLRDEIGRAGYTEVLTHGLCSIRDNFTALRRATTDAVSLSNPANVEYQVVRTTLLPGLLKTLQHNKSASFASGFKIFEISDVVLPDAAHVSNGTVVGAKNVRRLAAIYAGPTSGFEIVHGLVDRVMTLTEVSPERAYAENSGKMEEEKFRVSREGWEYTIRAVPAEESEKGGAGVEGTYFPGRAAELLLTKPGVEGKVRIGTFGIIHPEVLSNFDVGYPASCLELDLELLM